MFFKIRPTEYTFGPILSNILKLSLSPYSVKTFAPAIAIEKVACPSLEQKVIIYFFFF